ncbi:CinA family protein [Aurantiacibacter spongiae]|uniref:CinA family protein n=1 Tax=Aurantiacibacter spongiae TaxID=2488860 RepID=A0A3N5CNY0_9SPHN|nr:CinA family protein [Aurantiacibacter spongiae]RPF70673.1 CinA family protein [Aurantiacibacter spongiae]
MADTLQPAIPTRLQEQARNVLKLACDVDRPIVTAESCTGGLLAALLTDIEGCSHIFERGFVTYSEEAKCDLLGLEREQIDSCGAVSKEVAIAMTQGALRRSRARVALAVTGFAGPAGEENEVGLVHFGCAVQGEETIHVEKHFGSIGREGVRIAALKTALDLLESAMRA